MADGDFNLTDLIPLLGGIGSAISPFVARGAQTAMGLASVLQNAQYHKTQQAYLAEQQAARQQQIDAANAQQALAHRVGSANQRLIDLLYQQSQPQGRDIAPVAPLVPGDQPVSVGRPSPIPVGPGDPDFDASGDYAPTGGSGTGGIPGAPVSDLVRTFKTTRNSGAMGGAGSTALRQMKISSGQIAPVSADDARLAALLNMESPAAGTQAIQAMMARQAAPQLPSAEEAGRMFGALIPGQEVSGVPIAGGGTFSAKQPFPANPPKEQGISAAAIAVRSTGAKTGIPALDAMTPGQATQAMKRGGPATRYFQTTDEDGNVVMASVAPDGTVAAVPVPGAHKPKKPMSAAEKLVADLTGGGKPAADDPVIERRVTADGRVLGKTKSGQIVEIK